MRTRVFAACAAAGLLFAAACRKKQPEQVPQPKAAEPAQAAAPAEKPPATAAGNYLRGQVDQIAKAKAAKELYEKTEKSNLDSLDLNKAGGN
ncbi:MAG: hypothetical protein M0011_15475 [Elusimicrobia bacterium]|nr:hypothetical protein [Elusimicrobiota bacterium]